MDIRAIQELVETLLQAKHLNHYEQEPYFKQILALLKPTRVAGKCGDCNGIEFTLLERCNNCSTEEIIERLRGSR